MFALISLVAALQSPAPIALDVDARQASRGLFLVTERFPATSGSLALQYPNWMPGAHSPAGSQGGIIKFKIFADGRALPWTRDLVDMSTVRSEVPAGAKEIRVEYTVAGRAPA